MRDDLSCHSLVWDPVLLQISVRSEGGRCPASDLSGDMAEGDVLHLDRVGVPSDVFASAHRYTGRALPGIAIKLLYTDAHAPAGKSTPEELEDSLTENEQNDSSPLGRRRRGKDPPVVADRAVLPIADGRDPVGPEGSAAAEESCGADEEWVLVHGGRTKPGGHTGR